MDGRHFYAIVKVSGDEDDEGDESDEFVDSAACRQEADRFNREIAPVHARSEQAMARYMGKPSAATCKGMTDAMAEQLAVSRRLASSQRPRRTSSASSNTAAS